MSKSQSCAIGKAAKIISGAGILLFRGAIVKCNIIRGIAVSALLIVAPFSVANAADMALKAAPPPAPVDSWTGFYLGVGVGERSSVVDSSITTATSVLNRKFATLRLGFDLSVVHAEAFD